MERPSLGEKTAGSVLQTPHTRKKLYQAMGEGGWAKVEALLLKGLSSSKNSRKKHVLKTFSPTSTTTGKE